MHSPPLVFWGQVALLGEWLAHHCWPAGLQHAPAILLGVVLGTWCHHPPLVPACGVCGTGVGEVLLGAPG
jgi:hypothetical protein